MDHTMKHKETKSLERMEPDCFVESQPMALVSIAISLKRIADALGQCDQYGQTGSAAVLSAIRDGIREARP